MIPVSPEYEIYLRLSGRDLSTPAKVSIAYEPDRLRTLAEGGPRPDLPGVVDPLAVQMFIRDSHGGWRLLGGYLDRSDGTVTAEVPSAAQAVRLALFVPTKWFGDTVGHWAQNEIFILTARNVVQGVSETAFEPDRAVTRAELAVLLSRVLPESAMKREDPEPWFSDVHESEWYFSAVVAVRALGLMRGYEDGSFRPMAIFTRQELAQVLSNVLIAMSKVVPPYDAQQVARQYVDQQEIAPWARDAVALVTRVGLMKGTPDNMFAPNEPVTRAQAATVMVHLGSLLGIFERKSQ